MSVEEEVKRLKERIAQLEGKGRALDADELQELRQEAERQGNTRLLQALNTSTRSAAHIERAVLIET